MENHHFFEWANQLFLWAIFNTYVKLPEGNDNIFPRLYDGCKYRHPGVDRICHVQK